MKDGLKFDTGTANTEQKLPHKLRMNWSPPTIVYIYATICNMFHNSKAESMLFGLCCRLQVFSLNESKTSLDLATKLKEHELKAIIMINPSS